MFISLYFAKHLSANHSELPPLEDSFTAILDFLRDISNFFYYILRTLIMASPVMYYVLDTE